MFEKIDYDDDLNARQQENYNFFKVAARLADYGFNCIRLSDDWQGADFIACHRDGSTYLKVQLKGRLAIDRKYQDKEIYIAFILQDKLFLYDHDRLVCYIEDNGLIGDDSSTWHQMGYRHWKRPPAWALKYFSENKILE